ncbi:choline binding protein [Streptococcus pneumoniae]|nr:choline binding protein [Streptococcus pneumoniae]
MNKRLFLKMSLVTLPILALFSQPVLAEENIHFSSCKEAWANGYSDIHEGEPGYSAKLDRDHDGVACGFKKAPKGAFKAKQSTAIQINTSSATTSGWVKQDGAWYYFDGNGNLVKNAWQGSYYLKADGKMAQSEWIYDSSYQAWYYLTSDGSYAYSTWQGNYYLKSDGKMAVNEWVDGGRYYVGADGVWKEGQASTASSSNDSNSEYSAALGKAKSYNSLFHMSKKTYV